MDLPQDKELMSSLLELWHLGVPLRRVAGWRNPCLLAGQGLFESSRGKVDFWEMPQGKASSRPRENLLVFLSCVEQIVVL